MQFQLASFKKAMSTAHKDGMLQHKEKQAWVHLLIPIKHKQAKMREATNFQAFYTSHLVCKIEAIILVHSHITWSQAVLNLKMKEPNNIQLNDPIASFALTNHVPSSLYGIQNKTSPLRIKK